MFRLIFVDDEAIIRNGISKVVPWGQNGFELVGLFEHGQQALDYIRDNPVDVVVTDINMPKMDGLTLSRILADQYPKITVLILTGYDDFEYAQKAVKNQVREFLLKPITADELKDVLKTVNEELLLIQEQEKAQEEMKEKLSQSFPLLKERFFNRLVRGKINREDFIRRREYFQWIDKEGLYQVSVISIPESWSELERVTLRELIKKTIGPFDVVFFDLWENLVIIFQGEKPEKLQNRAGRTLEHIFQILGAQEKDQISAGCGEVVDSYESLTDSYEGAGTAVDYSRVLGLTQILFIKDVRDKGRIVPELFQSRLDSFIEALKEGGSGETLGALKDIFSYLEQKYMAHDEASSYYSLIHFNILNFLIDMGIQKEDDSFFPYKPQYYPTMNVAKESFEGYVREIERKIESRRNDVILSRVDKAKEIIANRFGESGFSLQDMCGELFLSTSQFSFLFKEGTGQTFIEYLTSYRVEEAKKLLKSTDMKAYEIAEAVGYQDSRYFSIIFKKQTGITAMEYRKRLEE